MVPTRFASLALILLYVLHALTDSSAYLCEGSDRRHENGLSGEDILYLKKELLDNVVRGDENGKMKLGVRKMMMTEALRKDNTNKKEEAPNINGKTSTINSGKDINASKTTQDRFSDHQEKRPSLESTALKSASLVAPEKKTVHFAASNNTKKQLPHGFSQDTSNKGSLEYSSLRSNKLDSDCGDQVSNMVREDYVGVDDPCRSRTPINN